MRSPMQDAWLVALGPLIEAALESTETIQEEADMLDRVAWLLRDHAETRDRHRRELNEEIRAQERAGRESYAMGLEDGRSRAWEER